MRRRARCSTATSPRSASTSSASPPTARRPRSPRRWRSCRRRRPGRPCRVTLDGRTRKVAFTEANILDSARAAGLPAPFACKAGVCATCRAKVTSGKVEMAARYGLTDEEVAAGYVLTCQSVPVGDGRRGGLRRLTCAALALSASHAERNRPRPGARRAAPIFRRSQSDSLLALIAHGQRRSAAGQDRRRRRRLSRRRRATRRSCAVIKEAERSCSETQETKAYLGSAGDKRFAELLRPILLGEHADDERIAGLQTPGGCGALRLGFELIATANPGARVLVGTPTWPNHPPIIRAVGLEIVEYPYYDRESARDPLRRDDGGARRRARGRRRPAPRLLPQSDRRRPRRRAMGRGRRGSSRERGLLPFVDIAYQGFGRGLDEDAARAARHARRLRRGDRRAELRQEFQRLSRPRRLAVRQDRARPRRPRRRWRMCSSARARCGRCRPIMARRRCGIVLDDAGASRADWPVELDAMRDRINAVRQRIAAADPRLAYIGGQFGMFSMLPLEQGAGARAARATMRSTWPTAAASTSSAWPTMQIDRFIAAVVEALDALTAMADRDPGRGLRRRELARGREAGPDQPGDGPARRSRSSFPPRRSSTNSRRAATTWRRCCSGLQLKDGDAACGYYRSRPLLLALGVPLADALGSGMGLAGGYSDGRDIGVGVQLPQSGRRPCAADVRRGRRAIYAGGRLGAGDRLQDQGPEGRARRRDRGGARRRRELRHRRILVRANNCHDTTIAVAHLHRGQWLRNLGSVGISDTWQGYRRQSRELSRA